MSDFFSNIFEDLYDYGADSVDKLFSAGKDLVRETRLDKMLSGDEYDFSGRTGSSPLGGKFMESLRIAPRKPVDTDANSVAMFAMPQSFQATQTRGNEAVSAKALESEWLDRLGSLYASMAKLSRTTETSLKKYGTD
jgi:hypothetical protein